MKKFFKFDVNEHALKEIGRLLSTEELQTFVINCFSKHDLAEAIVHTWKQKNISTNTRIETYVINHVIKEGKYDSTN